MVQWGGSSRATTFLSSSKLLARIMAADLAAAGKVAVTVVNPAPGGGGSNTATFTIAPDTITFMSDGALDGSDALNFNRTINVWIVNPDGSRATPLTRLTALSADSMDPAWSPDGTKIASRSTRALDGSDAADINVIENIWVMNSDGSAATALTRLAAANAHSRQPAWSPDGSKVVFASQRALDGSDNANTNGTQNIWVMNADGSAATALTKLTAANAVSSIPAWSPDGSKIAFDSERALDGSDAANTNFTHNIWVMNADGSGATPLTKLTAHPVFGGQPAWSPDGSKVAYSSSRALDGSDAANTNNTGNIWVVSADGSGAPLTKLTAVSADSFDPAWSPDGSKVVCASRRALDGSDAANTNRTFNLWVVNADGTGATSLTKLTAANASSRGPTWSPDGSKIFFESQRALDGSDAANTNSTFNIWMVSADGTVATPLTKLTALGIINLEPRQP
jgi:Tol biopolymer transport system component